MLRRATVWSQQARLPRLGSVWTRSTLLTTCSHASCTHSSTSPARQPQARTAIRMCGSANVTKSSHGLCGGSVRRPCVSVRVAALATRTRTSAAVKLSGRPGRPIVLTSTNQNLHHIAFLVRGPDEKRKGNVRGIAVPCRFGERVAGVKFRVPDRGVPDAAVDLQPIRRFLRRRPLALPRRLCPPLEDEPRAVHSA